VLELELFVNVSTVNDRSPGVNALVDLGSVSPELTARSNLLEQEVSGLLTVGIFLF